MPARRRHGPGRPGQVRGQQVIAWQVPVRLFGSCTVAQLPGPHQRKVGPGHGTAMVPRAVPRTSTFSIAPWPNPLRQGH
jgi:hypothetical protein